MLCNQSLDHLPLVTLGLLTYNNKETLRRSLESLVHQDYPNKELIIFDDCSTDGTFETCKDYAKQFPFIKLFRNEKNMGCYANLKNLIHQTRQSSSEFFVWVCPDDWYAPSFTRQHIEFLCSNLDCPIVLSTTHLIFENPITLEGMPENQVIDFQKLLFKDYTPSQRKEIAHHIIKISLSNYCLFIQGMIRKQFLDVYLMNKYFFSIEELFPLFFFYQGGLGTIPEMLHAKYQSLIPLSQRNPEAARVAYSWKSKCISLFFFIKLIFKQPFQGDQRRELCVIACRALYDYTGISLRSTLYKSKFYKYLSPLYRRLKRLKYA